MIAHILGGLVGMVVGVIILLVLFAAMVNFQGRYR